MSATWISITLAVVTIIVALLISSGALGFYMKYNTRVTIVERDSTKALAKTEEHDKDLASTRAEMSGMKTTLEDIKKELYNISGKFSTLESIKTTVDSLSEAVNKNMVNRSEHEQFWAGIKDSQIAMRDELKESRDIAQRAEGKAEKALFQASNKGNNCNS